MNNVMKKAFKRTTEEDLLEWTDQQVEDKSEFRNRSQLIEVALIEFRKHEAKDSNV